MLGREFLFHSFAWESGEGVSKVPNRFGANGKSLPQAVLIQVSEADAFLSSGLPGKAGVLELDLQVQGERRYTSRAI